MIIYFHKNFEKAYQKLQKNEQQKIKIRLALFLENSFHPLLNNHELKGEYASHFSINISGDLRAHYKLVGKNKVLFTIVGTHSQLYR
ncbi:type II toxin-antitoxin system mRNA interferase toxin, RelE/StbE family [Candidatus Azambacteria bacterium]|nr:type II toxin-antitoxin system mRNA interferase toxin, RelE/StbE family [Candidatus Azambacteria bacterium]